MLKDFKRSFGPKLSLQIEETEFQRGSDPRSMVYVGPFHVGHTDSLAFYENQGPRTLLGTLRGSEVSMEFNCT